ncbi:MULTISPECIES: hybrid sensor histidine kinase/response regulator [unclassified Janthinobacterium]|uniref:hybrid sensor histidine kinase/response regulator n=1 Tax=unclassified Janthinobacterium TaxID=2610881 RepID=UPI00034D0A26|nr:MULTISPECIES: Hpt domain-containing protein [unclassified Janthinobacterium]MEC5159649.1 chemosensory pili system protein ChpA (sensor histidine kinase/response regulator) [Janthinobacterium sp. CG_S6]
MSTTDFSPAPGAPHPAPAGFDAGPLSWVMAEVREALGRSRTALFEAGGRQLEERATALQHAKSHLHQAHGALLMVDVDGVGLLTQAAEQALERFKLGSLEYNVDNAQAVAELYQGVIEYLDELLAGAPAQPARLFPYYRALQTLLGAERSHPADLFFPPPPGAVSIRAAAEPAPQDYPAYRQRFEKALLPFLKSAAGPEQDGHANALREAVKLVADAQQDGPARTFWCVMQSFAELVAAGELASGLYVKQLFGLINLQMRRLTQGSATQPEGMLRDALFFIASVARPTPAALQMRKAYRLDGLVPPDYDVKRYGRIDAAALEQARQALAQAKAAWGKLAEAAADAHAPGGAADPALEAAFAQALAQVARQAALLKVPALDALMRQLGEVAAAAARRGPDLALEMATALLFAEHGLAQIRRLPDDFAGNAASIVARLAALVAGDAPPAPSQWQGEMARRIEQEQTVAALAAEMKAGLRQVEKVLDEYYADPARRPALAQVDPLLHQLQGALAILDQDHAMRAAQHVQQAVRRLAQGQDQPGGAAGALDEIAQNVGALGFFVDMLGRNAEAAKGRFHFDPANGAFRAIPYGRIAAAEPVPLLDEELAAAPAPAAPPEAPAPRGDAAVEAELLDIFIGEARDALSFVEGTLARPRAHSAGADQMAMLRRSFHTLKGSGRMVGLNQFAEAAGAVERVMNVWLAEDRAPNDELFGLLAHSWSLLSDWLAEVADGAASQRSAAALVAAAERVQHGAAFAPDESGAPIGGVDLDEGAAAARPPAPDSNVIDFPTAPSAPRDDNLKQVGELDISLPLYNIYVAETDELLRLLSVDFSEWRHEPRRAVSAEALHAAHTLTGSSGTVGFKALRELAHALEQALEVAVPPAPGLNEAQRGVLDQVTQRVGKMLQSFALGELAPEQPQLLAALQQLREQLLQAPGEEQAAHLDQMDQLDQLEGRLNALFAATYDSIVGAGAAAAPAPAPAPAAPVATPAPASEPAAAALSSAPAEPASQLDALFAAAYQSIVGKPPQPGAAADTAADEAPTAKPAPPPASDTSDVDDLFDAIFDDALAAPLLTQAEPLAELAPEPPAQVEAAAQPESGSAAAPELGVESAPEREAMIQSLAAPALVEEVLVVAASPRDELDVDLLPVFLEEGADLLPQIGQALRTWQHNPDDLAQAQMLLRLLHTVKGSARMAGAMRLGQYAHEIETHIENMLHAGIATAHAFEELLAHYDHALLLFEQLQQAPGQAAGAGQAGAPGEAAPAADAKVALVRVRADILDRLVNQAGEVSITRSKLENEVGSLRSSLLEFADNLTRLRRQLREVEMQAESQIASRMAISSEREFDPLEFDRFTRLQELTRMMAESVNDAASFHDNLTRTVDSAADDLVLQGRLTRELQRDLMRVRMVPFASIAERLFRVARQSAKEVDKRVNLDLRGGAVEIDRSVLERMAAPFEHLLRNAIAHGVESRAGRVAAGKSETGELLVQVSQQGNEVVIEFSDDGAGLDLARIRAKARSSGLLGPDEEVDDERAGALIFQPGFSTADSLTELAGRGVGMDIVRSEALALGGRVDILSQPGVGACFTVHLPLTLAVTQVVLLSCGGTTYALPSLLVEQVQQLKEAALAAAHAAGALESQGQQVALHYLSHLLGEEAARPQLQRSSPVLMLRNGNDRLALQVDEVLGNREVVIKNVGPQLARMAGIAGATVLGSGDIVLILNPVALAQHLALHPELRAHHPGAAAAGRADGGAPLPRDTLIMVVDDSLTVRRVTQRLLEREGYQVALAKDGVDALEQLQGVTPALMLVDIEMPRMDGFDLTRNVRGDARTRAIPIIMITSRSADKHRNYAMELGVNAYFGKPFQEPLLLAAISGLLAP